MSVYVDNMKAHYRGMIMCHMIADSEEELVNMAKKINLNLKWHQFPNTAKSHFDICLSKKKLAIKFGAIEITSKDLVKKIIKRRKN